MYMRGMIQELLGYLLVIRQTSGFVPLLPVQSLRLPVSTQQDQGVMGGILVVPMVVW